MVINLHFENFIPLMISVAIDAFNEKRKKISNDILMAIIVQIKNSDTELKTRLYEIEENPEVVNGINEDDFYDLMIPFQDMIESTLNLSSKYKDKSDLFAQLHKAIDEVYSTTIVLTNEVAFVKSELKIEQI